MKFFLFGILAVFIQLSNGFPSNLPSLKDSGRDLERRYVYQGDMVLSAKQVEELTSKSAIDPRYLNNIWPNVVPYEFEEGTGHNNKSKAIVKEAMDYIMDQTSKCVTFVEHTNEPSFVVIKYDTDGCQSDVAKTAKQPQYLWMSELSCDMGRVAHELLHTLGLKHEQSRPDRDDYVKILYENIEGDNAYNFDKDPEGFSTYGFSYDYDSIMHYGEYEFAKVKDGKKMPTIQVLQEGAKIGQRDHLSKKNIQLIKAVYKCT